MFREAQTWRILPTTHAVKCVKSGIPGQDLVTVSNVLLLAEDKMDFRSHIKYGTFGLIYIV